MWSGEQLRRLHEQISTPAFVLNKRRLKENIAAMQQQADSKKRRLRLHIKTHKTPDIARMQLDAGANGITVAKAAEALTFARHGFDDIFIASQVTQPLKRNTLRETLQQARLICAIDHPDQLDLYSAVAPPEKNLELRIEIDCGFGRCGLAPEDPLLAQLAKQIQITEGVELEGLFSHAGQAYKAKNRQERQRAADEEMDALLKARDALKAIGIEVATLSVGATPTAALYRSNPYINEMRPGNYVFYDGIQQALGACEDKQVSLYVLATVISTPATDRVVCDAGSKALTTDAGAHGSGLVEGFGRISGSSTFLHRLSEEHGIIAWTTEEDLPEIGSALLIRPNHACVATNLYDKIHLVDEQGFVQTLPIAARGKSQ